MTKENNYHIKIYAELKMDGGDQTDSMLVSQFDSYKKTYIIPYREINKEIRENISIINPFFYACAKYLNECYAPNFSGTFIIIYNFPNSSEIYKRLVFRSKEKVIKQVVITKEIEEDRIFSFGSISEIINNK